MSSFFDCTQCGDCCQGHGGTYVDENKIKQIAGYLKISVENLKENYLTLSSEKRYMIACGENGKCIFFKNNCTIHPVKPRMCREWPFIPAVIREPDNWNQMSEVCPGIRTDIKYSDLKTFILKTLEQTRSKHDILKLRTESLHDRNF